MDVTTFDILVLLIVGLLAVMGAVRGFVTEILTLLSWVAGVIALTLFYPSAKAIAAVYIGGETAAAATAFVAVFLSVFILFRLVAKALGNRTKRSVVGPVDRVLGLGFGAVKGLIIVSLLFLVLTRGHALLWGAGERLPEWLTAARTEPLLDVTSRAIIDFSTERQRGQGLGDDAAKRSEGEEGGYTDETRDALDDLLEETGGTQI